MDFPPNYEFALDEDAMKELSQHCERGENYEYTSLKTKNYNCIAYVLDIYTQWVQLYDQWGRHKVDAASYISFFQENGFSITLNGDFEQGKYKIAVYTDSGLQPEEFRHVARLLSSNKWSSKLGRGEDIEHNTPEVLIGNLYGDKIILMEKAI